MNEKKINHSSNNNVRVVGQIRRVKGQVYSH